MLIGCIFFAMLLGANLLAETDAESEENDTLAPQGSPLAGMTVDDILKTVNAPARETYRGVISDVGTGAVVIIRRDKTSVNARLYGVDCPEPGQPGHQEAKKFATDKFRNANVNVCEFATDSEQNPVVLVFNADGESLSHLLVAEGMAWWDRRNTPKDVLLRRLNAEAITNFVGLYADMAALAPWDYRDSRGMEQFTYTIGEATAPEPQASAPQSSADEEGIRSISARGTMTESAQRAPVTIPKGIEKDVDIMGLMGKHQPHIVEDDAGKPLGLTATNISQIPFATEFGLRDGDIISSVNGIAVQSIPQIMEMAPQFAGVKQFNVEIIRNGQRTTIPITIN